MGVALTSRPFCSFLLLSCQSDQKWVGSEHPGIDTDVNGNDTEVVVQHVCTCGGINAERSPTFSLVFTLYLLHIMVVTGVWASGNQRVVWHASEVNHSHGHEQRIVIIAISYVCGLRWMSFDHRRLSRFVLHVKVVHQQLLTRCINRRCGQKPWLASSACKLFPLTRQAGIWIKHSTVVVRLQIRSL